MIIRSVATIGATLLALTTAAGGTAGAAEPPLPADAVAHGGHHYLLVDEVESLSWDGARQSCEERGAHLAVVTDADEAEFIAGLCDGRYMFLGASDTGTEGEWRWVDGSTWDYTNWMKGQPNDYTGTEDYLATYDGGAWVDVDAKGDDFWMPTGFVCEWDH